MGFAYLVAWGRIDQGKGHRLLTETVAIIARLTIRTKLAVIPELFALPLKFLL